MLLAVTMWKKRFLPNSRDDKTTVPHQTTSSELNNLQGQDAQLQQHHGRQLHPDAYHNFKVPVQSNNTPAQFSSNHWTQVPVVQQVVPTNMVQSNPINHINQQQVVYNMEIHRARQENEMHPYISVSGMYNYLSVPFLPTITPASTPMHDMMDERTQHERYLQQARDMQVPGTEQWVNKLLPGESRKGEGPLMNADTYRFSNTEHVNKMMSRRNSYKAVMKNGELVESKNGHLIVTHNLPLNNNQESLYSDIPLDLSMKSGSSQMEVKQLDTDSVFINSPPPNNDDARGINLARNVPNQSLVKSEKINNKDISLKVTNMTKLLPRIAPKPSPVNVLATKPPLVKAIQPKDEVLGEETKDQTIAGTDPATLEREDIHRMFPLLKTTNTGSLVLWNFLWALLQDENYNTILSWVSFNNLKFRIVNPSMLATFWGKVKQNPAMDWGKIKKILDLYQRKNLIISCQTELEFIFKIIPKTVKDNLESANK